MKLLSIIIGVMLTSIVFNSSLYGQELPDSSGPVPLPDICTTIVFNFTPHLINVGAKVGSELARLGEAVPGGIKLLHAPCFLESFTVVLATGSDDKLLLNGKPYMYVMVPLVYGNPQAVVAFPEGTIIPGVINR